MSVRDASGDGQSRSRIEVEGKSEKDGSGGEQRPRNVKGSGLRRVLRYRCYPCLDPFGDATCFRNLPPSAARMSSA